MADQRGVEMFLLNSLVGIGPYGGYIDFAGEEGNLAWNINSDTQLLLDVGEHLGYKNQLWAGIELLLPAQ